MLNMFFQSKLTLFVIEEDFDMLYSRAYLLLLKIIFCNTR